jgi:hypothetical protein
MPQTSFTDLLNLIAAVGALGTAAMGLVDAFKVFWGGPSNFGYGFIEAAVKRFVPTTADGPAAFGQADILRTLRANWLNGVAEADQKAKAKAMIHLRLTKGDAPALAALAGVDAATLQSVAEKAMTGGQVTPTEIAVLGQFDAVLSAVLDEAYERADQKYRNAAKLLSVIVATLLATFAGSLLGINLWASFFVGLISAPLAPVAKDLSTTLQSAATAVRAVKAQQ